MKKKLITFLMVICSLLSVVGLAACGEEPHVHSFSSAYSYDAENHWVVCECGEKSSVEAHKGGTATETAKAVCEVCSQEYGELLAHTHNFNKEVANESYLKEEAKCESKAIYYYSCACGEKGETTFEYGEALGHTEVIDAAVPATCTEAGLTEGKHCSVCETVLVAQEEVAALGHTEAVLEAVAATCTETGLTEGKICSVCETVLVAQEVVAVVPHTEAVLEAVAPTCTATGLTEGKICSVCEEVLVAQEVVAKLPHTEVIDKAVAATCTATGLTEGKHCSVCEEVLVAQEVVAKLPHTEVVDAAVAPTCTTTGLTEGKHCSVCEEVLVAQEVVAVVPHTEAVLEAVAPTCTETGLTEGKYCSVCEEILVAQEVVPASHTVVIDEAVAPTCTTTGLTEGKHCSVCEEVLVAQEVVAVIPHTYEAVVTAPTCLAQGFTTYTCECGESYVDDYVEILEHVYTDWTPNGDGTISKKCINGCNNAFTAKLISDKVLYSADDKALDLPSLKAAFYNENLTINSLKDISKYIVNEEEVEELELEVIISNDTKKNYGRDRAVDTAQEVRLVINGELYFLTNVYAYTKVIDEAEDLNYFVMDGSKEMNEIDGYFVLSRNIDATNFDIKEHKFEGDLVYPGKGFKSDIGLRGVLDGQGYVIDGLTTKNSGLFANMNAAIVKNIAFTNVNITGYYGSLFAKNFIRGKDYENGFNGYEGKFENVYVSVKSISYVGSNGHIGILTQGTLPGTVVVENVIIDYLNVDETTQSKIDAGNQFLMFGSSTLSMANDIARFKNSFSISPAPVSQLAKMPGFAENQVEFTLSEDGKSVASVGAVLDPQVTEVLTRAGKTLAVDHVFVGLRAYDDYTAMAADATANADKLATFGEYWVVKNGVAYWKEVYKNNFTVQAKQGDNAIEGEIELKDAETAITLNVVDNAGNVIPATITAPEGIILEGNVIKLASKPTSVGSYEVKLTAEVEDMLIEKWVVINYSNEIEVEGKVLYSAYDKALDETSLKAALNAVGVEDIESIDAYIVNGEEVEELDLEVIISGKLQTRTVDTAQPVAIKVGDSVYKLNVYAYTRLIDELSDLDYFTREKETLEDGTVLYDIYNGYYLMTKNIDGAGLGEEGANYKLAGLQTSASSKDNGLTGVFDGNGYTISNVIIQSKGLFVMVKGGVVKNIAFKGCEITGYYPVVIAHAFTNFDIDGDGKKDIPLLKNVYVEGTIVNLNYTASGREAGILTQNNFYSYAENVIVKHELNDAQKENMSVKRFGIFMTQYYHKSGIANNSGMNSFYKDFYVISDAPLAFGFHASSTTWSHFLFAQNTVQLNADNKWELKDATKFAVLNDLLTRTYTIGGTDYTWDTSDSVNADKAMAIDITSNIKQYIAASDMAAAGNDYANFDSAYWTIVDGVPTWNSLNA